MQRTKQQPFFLIDIYGSHEPANVSHLVKRGLKELAWFFQPEDTAGTGHYQEASTVRNFLKTTVWTVAAISLSLAAAQLH